MFQTGQMYMCDNCGAEIQVTKSANSGEGGDQNPVCCCGQQMIPSGASAQGGATSL